MKNSFFILFLVFFIFSGANSFATNLDTTFISRKEQNYLNSFKASYSGATSSGNNYKLYAIKAGKDWALLVMDSLTIYSLLQQKKIDEPVENSIFFTTGLNRLFQTNLLKKKEKGKKIADLEFNCYYKLTNKGKKAYKSLALLEKRSASFVSMPVDGKKLAEYEQKANELDRKQRRVNNSIRRMKRLEKKIMKHL